MTDQYLTVSTPSEGIYKEKGSKFIAYLYPIESDEEAMMHVADLKKRFHDARHHCYAYQLGVDGEKYRENDDGEPSGTAGKPIRGQIRSKGLTHVLIVVVRYFGGTKLGVPGLIHAYKSAALDAIENALVVEMVVEQEVAFSFDFLLMNDVMRLIKDRGAHIKSQDYQSETIFYVSIRQSHYTSFIDHLSKIRGVTIL